jgi:hypothetical protein
MAPVLKINFARHHKPHLSFSHNYFIDKRFGYIVHQQKF